MQHTHFHDEYGELVKARAYSYTRQGEAGYRYIALSYSNVGATSLFTTVEDLALWDENFYTGKIGGKDLLAQMQIKGKLNTGTEIGYASALVIGSYRGLKTVEHGGGDAGFRTELLRFPDQHFSVIALCNAAEANPGSLARQVADIFLAAKMEEVPNNPRPTEIKIDPHKLDAYVGMYALDGGLRISFWREGDQFVTQAVGQPSAPVFPFSETGFLVKAFDAQVTFDNPDDSGKAQGFNLHENGRDRRAKRIEPVQLKSEQLQAYAGTFYSDDLNTLYTVTARDGKLFLNYPRDEIEIVPSTSGAFTAPFPIETVTYKWVEPQALNSFTVGSGRVQNLRFDRVEPQVGRVPPLNGRTFLQLRRPLLRVSAPFRSNARNQPDFEVQPQSERGAFKGVECRAALGRIEQPVDGRTAGSHSTGHFGWRDPLGLHGLPKSVCEDLLARQGPNLFELTEVLEHLFQLVFGPLLHVPSFMRLRARAITAAGVRCVFF